MNEENILDSEQSFETVADDNILDTSAVASPDAVDEGLSSEDSGAGAEAFILEYPDYSFENPLPVILVDEVIPEVSTFALYDTYPGTISDSYLDYFEGIVQKLPFNVHYVVWRSGAYSYTLAYGEELSLDGSLFTGNCDYVQIYRENTNDYNSTWYTTSGTQEVYLDAESLFVYSDLGMYSTLERGLGSIEANMVLFAIGVFFVYGICHSFFDHIRRRVFRR